MKKRWLGTIAALAVAALAVGAGPAFTQSTPTGTVAVTITAQATAAPCLTVTPGAVNFGPLPFSTSNSISQASTNITVGFCGTATGQNLLGSTTPATGPSGSWTPLTDGAINSCPALNEFHLNLSSLTTFYLFMTGTPAPVLQSVAGPPAVFPAGDKVFGLGIFMPCQGSNGAGDTKTLTATFTAVVA